MSSRAPYGSLGIAEAHPTVRRIWYTRDDDLPELPIMCGPASADTLEELEVRELVTRALEAVPPGGQRAAGVVVRHVVEGYTLAEIARAMQVSVERVRQLERLGLRVLARHIRRVSKPELKAMQ